MSRVSRIESRELTRYCNKIHTFRAVSDGVFVHRETYDQIRDGRFARKFKERDMAIIIGEVEKEVRSGRWPRTCDVESLLTSG